MAVILAGSTKSLGSEKYDGWLIKTDEKGKEEWSETFGGNEFDGIYSVQQTKDGGYILAGSTESFGSEKYDGWLIKTDEKGKKEWTKTIGGNEDDLFISVQQTKDGGYILSGRTKSYDSNDSDDWDGWLIKTDENGNVSD